MFKLEVIKKHQNSIIIFIAILLAFITILLIVDPLVNKNYSMSTQNIAKKSIEYLNNNILQQGQAATLVSFSEEKGLIKIKLKIADQDYDSYVTKDGKLFFPEGLDITNNENQIVAE